MALGSDGLLTVVGDLDTVISDAMSGKLTITPSAQINLNGKIYTPVKQQVNISPADGTFTVKLPPTPPGVTYRFSLAAYSFLDGQRQTFLNEFDAPLTVADGDEGGIVQFSELEPVAAPGVPQTFLTRTAADLRYVRTVNNVGPDVHGNVTVEGGGGGGNGGVAGVATVNGRAGAVVLAKTDVGLGSVDNVPAADLRARSTHTGSQSASTISDFTTASRAVLDNYLEQGTNITLSVSNGKLQISATGVTAPVSSVNGKTGAVSLLKADVGLGNVANTADLDKPVSTATQTALSGKASTSHTHPSTSITDLASAVQTIVRAYLRQGTNISFADGTGALTINSTATGGTGGTDAEGALDAVMSALREGAGISISSDDPNDTITISVTNIAPTQITGSTVTGRNLVTAVDGAAARGVIGAGTSSLTLGTSSSTAAAGNHTHTTAGLTDITAVGTAVAKATDQAAARSAIGAGTSSLTIGTGSGDAKAGNYQPAVADISDITFGTVRTFLKSTTSSAMRGAIGASEQGHTHDAVAIASGVIAPARLGTGTPSSTTVLLGDGTWGPLPSNGSDIGTLAWLKFLARDPEQLAVGAISRNANGAPTGFSVTWPTGGTGTFTGTPNTTTAPNDFDAYTVTHVLSGTTTTFTRAAPTRNSDGDVQNYPDVVIA